jgi:signal transduction histidine kinase
VPARGRAIRAALAGRRFVESFDQGRTIVIGLPLHAGGGAALLAIASRPELRAELGIVHDQILPATVIAIAVGAVAGLLISTLISVRLRRIAAAAAAIERGQFEVSLRPVFLDEVGELGMSVDRMRIRLRESFGGLTADRDRLERLLERLQQGVVALDRERRVLFANGAARQLFESRLREGEPIPDVWRGLALSQLVGNLYDPDASVAEARVCTDDERSLSIVGLPPGLSPGPVVLVVTDETERERQERAEMEFVANAAHELRTPVTAISSAVDALKAGAKGDPVERDRFLMVIERQTARLGRLARALLVLARAQTRQETVKLEPVNLRTLLLSVARELPAPANVSVEVHCPVNLAALAQPDLVEQVVSNLAINAAKHTREGKITLAGAPGPAGSVRLEVSDTGSGIDRIQQKRIFERFYVADSGSRDGFGLGLAIVRESVRALGGVVEIESKPGAGTTARVSLVASEGRA